MTSAASTAPTSLDDTLTGVGGWWHDGTVSLPGASATLIGRGADLAVLRGVFAEVESGEPRGIVLGGEAGIGKTRLIEEFKKVVRPSALVISGQCVDLGQVAAPYAPITSVLRDLVAMVGAPAVLEAAGPGRDSLSALLPSLGAEGVARDEGGVGRLHETVAVLLETFSRERPVVVIIEDLHWADGATLKLLTFLVRVLLCDRVMLLLSYRTDDVPRGHALRAFLTELDRTRRVLRHELGRLSKAQVRAQAKEILGLALAEPALDSVFSRSEGVPFFVEELLGLDETCSGCELPDTLRELLLGRYERLSPETQRVLRLISAGGVRVDHELVETVFLRDSAKRSPEELDLAVREAASANVIVADERTYAFRHALVREAIHTDLLPGERMRLHAAFADALEATSTDQPIAAEISHHWMLAREPARAFPATFTAMKQAHDAFAYSTEAQLGERLLELWNQVPEAELLAAKTRTELMLTVASALRNAGDSERAITMVDSALAEPGKRTTIVHAKLLRDKAAYLASLGRPGAVELLEEALALAPTGTTDSLRAGLLNALGARYMVRGDLDRSIALTDEAAVESRRIDSAQNASVAANLGGVCRIHRGELVEGLALLRTAEALARDDGNALLRYRVNASDMTNLLGRYEESLELATEGIKRAKALGVERTSGVILSSNAVDPLVALGRWDEADETLERALTLAPPLAFSVYLRQSKVLSTLWRGDVAGAVSLYRSWQGSLRRLAEQEVQTRFGVARVVVEISLATDDLDAAWVGTWPLTAPDHRVMPALDLPMLGVSARALARVREGTAASAFAESSALHGITLADFDAVEAKWRTVLEQGSFWPTAPIWAAVFDAELAGAARTGDDPDAWRIAVERVAAPAAPALLRAYADYRLGEAALAHGDRALAQKALQSAIDRATTLGAQLVASRAKTVIDRGGLTLEGRVRERHLRDSGVLTAREEQVLRLIAEGCTNRQIGERLFISTKTASVHVSAILRKLGVATRTEAAVLVRATV